MSLLAIEEQIDFKYLVKELQISDGNLATHIKTLEKASFIGVNKTFKDRKPHTSYYMTKEGRKAFERHLNLLEQLITKQS
jgi:DNA-binding MarR family transcriptional regulator